MTPPPTRAKVMVAVAGYRGTSTQEKSEVPAAAATYVQGRGGSKVIRQNRRDFHY